MNDFICYALLVVNCDIIKKDVQIGELLKKRGWMVWTWIILEGENNIVDETWKIGQKVFHPRRMKEREDGRMNIGSISLSEISRGVLQTVGSRFMLVSEGNSNLEFTLM